MNELDELNNDWQMFLVRAKNLTLILKGDGYVPEQFVKTFKKRVAMSMKDLDELSARTLAMIAERNKGKKPEKPTKFQREY